MNYRCYYEVNILVLYFKVLKVLLLEKLFNWNKKTRTRIVCSSPIGVILIFYQNYLKIVLEQKVKGSYS